MTDKQTDTQTDTTGNNITLAARVAITNKAVDNLVTHGHPYYGFLNALLFACWRSGLSYTGGTSARTCNFSYVPS